MLKRRLALLKVTDVTEGDMHYYYEAFHEFDKHQEGYISATVLGDLFRALGENPTSLELESLINEFEEDGGHIEFPSFIIMMARKAAEAKEKEHLHWQETFRVFTTPNSIPGTVTKVCGNATNGSGHANSQPDTSTSTTTTTQNAKIDAKGQEVTVVPRTYESSGMDKEPKVGDRELPIDEFRFVMSNLNISGRRIVEMWEVEEMINAVDDGDGNLSYEEFIQLIQQQNVTGTSANKSGDSEKK